MSRATRALLVLLGRAAAWECALRGGALTLVVQPAPPFTYAVVEARGGAAWLADGSLAVAVDGALRAPGRGLSPVGDAEAGAGADDFLGAYDYFSVVWEASTAAPPLRVVANFSCYAAHGAAVFSLAFPDGARGTALIPPLGPNPNPGTWARGSNVPATRFPSFDAASVGALRSVEWWGCGTLAFLDTGLGSFHGGTETGPLVLLNATGFATGDATRAAAPALVLGPADGFTTAALSVVPDADALPPADACAAPPLAATDFAHGAEPVPGHAAGDAVADAAACCTLCAALGRGACAAWVFDASVPAGTANCFPAASTPGSAGTMAKRSFGLMTGARLAGGVMGSVTSLPRGHTTRFALTAAPSVTDAVREYGAALRAAHKTVKMPKAADPYRNALTYWTDNGGYYFAGYWQLFFNATDNTPQAKLAELSRYHHSLGLTVGSYQLDPWWSDGANWSWAANWSAFPGYFPDGLAAAGVPLTLYANAFAAPPANEMPGPWTTSAWCDEHKGCFARVAPGAAYAFFSRIFDLGRRWGMNAWETDFSNFNFLAFNDTLTDVGAADAYYGGMNSAAAERGLPIQLCMGLPALTLGSVQWPAVTNARVQADGWPTQDGRLDVFAGGLLLGAVELAPFIDVMWTTAAQPAADNPYPIQDAPGTCPYVEVLAASAALSAGPVGFGDGVGFTNATLLNMTCRSDGVLLQPSLPAAPIEAWFVADARLAGASARIAAAPSFIPAAAAAAPPYPAPFAHAFPYPAPYAWVSALALDVADAFALAPCDFVPPLVAAPAARVESYVVSRLSPGLAASAAACADGAPAARCAAPFSAAAPVDARTGVGANRSVAHELFSFAPVFDGGWALVGEVDKFVHASPSRFVAVTPGPAPGCATPAAHGASLCVVAVGAPREALVVVLLAPEGVVRAVPLDFGAGGSVARVTCTAGGALAGTSACAVEYD